MAVEGGGQATRRIVRKSLAPWTLGTSRGHYTRGLVFRTYWHRAQGAPRVTTRYDPNPRFRAIDSDAPNVARSDAQRRLGACAQRRHAPRVRRRPLRRRRAGHLHGGAPRRGLPARRRPAAGYETNVKDPAFDVPLGDWALIPQAASWERRYLAAAIAKRTLVCRDAARS